MATIPNPSGNVESLTLLNPKPNAFGLFELLEFRTTDLRSKYITLVNYGPLRLTQADEYSITSPTAEIDMNDVLAVRASRQTLPENAVLFRTHSLDALVGNYSWLQGRGVGATLYCAAAVCADVFSAGGAPGSGVLGGTFSVENTRKAAADKLWNALVKLGVAKRLKPGPDVEVLRPTRITGYKIPTPFEQDRDYWIDAGYGEFQDATRRNPPVKVWQVQPDAGSSVPNSNVDTLLAKTVYELGIVVDMKTDFTWFMDYKHKQYMMERGGWVRPSADMLANIELRDPRDLVIRASYYRYVTGLIKDVMGKDAAAVIDKLNARPDVAEFLAGRKRSVSGLGGIPPRVRLPAKLANWPSL